MADEKKMSMQLVDKCVGKLISRFKKSTLRAQQMTSYSPSEIAGTIELAFRRGFQAGQEAP